MGLPWRGSPPGLLFIGQDPTLSTVPGPALGSKDTHGSTVEEGVWSGLLPRPSLPSGSPLRYLFFPVGVKRDPVGLLG